MDYESAKGLSEDLSEDIEGLRREIKSAATLIAKALLCVANSCPDIVEPYSLDDIKEPE